MYDITSFTSFDNAKARWLAEFDKFAERDTTIMLVGNKSDLGSARAVPTELAQAFAGDARLSSNH